MINATDMTSKTIMDRDSIQTRVGSNKTRSSYVYPSIDHHQIQIAYKTLKQMEMRVYGAIADTVLTISPEDSALLHTLFKHRPSDDLLARSKNHLQGKTSTLDTAPRIVWLPFSIPSAQSKIQIELQSRLGLLFVGEAHNIAIQGIGWYVVLCMLYDLI